jgi:hypothetical protein
VVELAGELRYLRARVQYYLSVSLNRIESPCDGRRHARSRAAGGQSGCRISAYSVEKLISCVLPILRMSHSVAENQT